MYLLSNGTIIKQYKIKLGGNPVGHKRPISSPIATPIRPIIYRWASAIPTAQIVPMPNRKTKTLGGIFLFMAGQRNGLQGAIGRRAASPLPIVRWRRFLPW
jgi:hypothetical protein